MVKAKHPNQLFFSQVGKEPLLPYYRSLKSLAQEHYFAEIGIEPGTYGSGVPYSPNRLSKI